MISAGIDTQVANTSLVVGTVIVRITFHSYTAYKWITLHSGGTATGRSVIATITFSIQSARITNQTRINTFPVNALLVVRTLIIGLASDLDTAILSVAREARFTVAYRMVIAYLTLSIGTAIARIDTFLIHARFRERTVRIGFAAHSNDVTC